MKISDSEALRFYRQHMGYPARFAGSAEVYARTLRDYNTPDFDMAYPGALEKWGRWEAEERLVRTYARQKALFDRGRELSDAQP